MRTLAPRNLTVACLLLALAACSTDTPTAPERTPAPPPGSGTSTAWNITISVDPRNLTQNASQPATVTVQVRRASDGAAPQNGTTVVVSAGLGEFVSAGSGVQAVVVELSGGGLAQLLYFAGAILGQDTVQAQLENSVGSARVNILEPQVLFIESVAPNSGPEGGGTRIRISGTGFSEPARVELGTGATAINATVDAVGTDADGEFIRAFTGQVFDPDTFFGTESCDTDGDGVEDGQRFLPTTVGVTVILTDGSETLNNAFTYKPGDTSCRDVTPAPNSPRAAFSFTASALSVQFFNETTPAGATFTWTFGDGSAFSTAENPTHTYPAADSYVVTLRAENASGSSTTTRTVTVSGVTATPVAQFSFTNVGLVVTFTNLSTPGGLTFGWDFGDATGSTTASPVHAYGGAGSYSVTLSASDASQTVTITKTVSVP